MSICISLLPKAEMASKGFRILDKCWYQWYELHPLEGEDFEERVMTAVMIPLYRKSIYDIDIKIAVTRVSKSGKVVPITNADIDNYHRTLVVEELERLNIIKGRKNRDNHYFGIKEESECLDSCDVCSEVMNGTL